MIEWWAEKRNISIYSVLSWIPSFCLLSLALLARPFSVLLCSCKMSQQSLTLRHLTQSFGKWRTVDNAGHWVIVCVCVCSSGWSSRQQHGGPAMAGHYRHSQHHAAMTGSSYSSYNTPPPRYRHHHRTNTDTRTFQREFRHAQSGGAAYSTGYDRCLFVYVYTLVEIGLLNIL